MKFLYQESVTLSLLFTAVALYFAATTPSILFNALVLAGLMHVLALLVVSNTNRL